MYQPSPALLKKYADVLVKFALRWGKWVKKNEAVFVQIPECAKPFYLPLQKAILEAGAHPMMEYLPDGVAKHFFDHANDDQIVYYPHHFLHGKVAQMTHVISIIAEADKYELKGVDPKKLAARRHSRKEYMDRRRDKENAGKHTWTIWMYGTPAMAKEAKMSLKEYRNQIIKACYLDYDDPVAQRKKTIKNIHRIKNWLDKMKIEYVHVTWPDADLKVKIGSDRKWIWWWWRNIPSFEIFTSPDCRATEGRIRFDQPLYVYGQMITWIELHFNKWVVTKFSAKENQKLLKEIIAIPNANRVGEFSLTDGRISHITKFMGETLFDENMWWKYGNMHIALGASYNDTRTWNVAKLSKKQAEKIWFNDSSEHKDIVSTAPKIVTAILKDGSKKVIYKNGKFMIDIG